jgi:hypothetical protein
MVEDEINGLTSDKQFDQSISLLHINSRSLVGNFDNFQTLGLQSIIIAPSK